MDSLKEVREAVSPFVGDSGMCADDPEVTKQINEARRILYELGDWKGTRSDLVIQSYGGTITLPAAYDFIIKSWSPVAKTDLPNEWFTVVTNGFSDMCGGMCKPLKMNESVITFRDYPMVFKDQCYFRVGIMWESDHEEADSEIVLHGHNALGGREALIRKYGTGFLEVTSNPPNDVFMRSLYQMIKPVTKGRVRVYEYLPDVVDSRICVSIFEKDDINPMLVRYRVENRRRSTTQYLVTVKKKYRAIVNDSDPVDVHTDALIHALQALTSRKGRNLAEFNSNMALATGFLNRELGKDQPFRQSFVKTAPIFSQSVTNLNDSDPFGY